MIVSIDKRKTEKIQCLFMIKSPHQSVYRGNISQHNEGHFMTNPIAHIIFNCENFLNFPLKSRTRQECPLSLLLFNIVLEFLTTETAIKGIQIWRWRGKTRSASTQELLILETNEFSKVVGYKNNMQKSIVFYTLIMKYQKYKVNNPV